MVIRRQKMRNRKKLRKMRQKERIKLKSMRIFLKRNVLLDDYVLSQK